MVRIVGVQRSDEVHSEFVLLQNQGSLRANLRGLTLLAARSLGTGQPALYVFPDDVDVAPGNFVLLKTGPCAEKWCLTRDGQRVFYTGMGHTSPFWSRLPGEVHLLGIQHTFCERSAEPVLV
ncbi:MAG: hypothetical protein AB7F50_02935 [Fimbriimonadaceae bacterium]